MIDKSLKQWYEAGKKKPRKGLWWGGSSSTHDYEGEAYGTTPAASYSAPSSSSDPSPSHDHGGSGEGWQTYAIEPAPAPVDYSELDNEEQAAVDRGEPTAQMTPKERNEQGYGPG